MIDKWLPALGLEYRIFPDIYKSNDKNVILYVLNRKEHVHFEVYFGIARLAWDALKDCSFFKGSERVWDIIGVCALDLLGNICSDRPWQSRCSGPSALVFDLRFLVSI